MPLGNAESGNKNANGFQIFLLYHILAFFSILFIRLVKKCFVTAKYTVDFF